MGQQTGPGAAPLDGARRQRGLHEAFTARTGQPQLTCSCCESPVDLPFRAANRSPPWAHLLAMFWSRSSTNADHLPLYRLRGLREICRFRRKRQISRRPRNRIFADQNMGQQTGPGAAPLDGARRQRGLHEAFTARTGQPQLTCSCAGACLPPHRACPGPCSGQQICGPSSLVSPPRPSRDLPFPTETANLAKASEPHIC